MARAKWMGWVAKLAVAAAALACGPWVRAEFAAASHVLPSPASSFHREVLAAEQPKARLDGLRLVFARTPAQRAKLEELLAAQQDAGSPSYHQWLSPEQFAAQFGATPEQVQAARGWLSRQGFVVGNVARGGGWIGFSGTAAQVERAFSLKLGQDGSGSSAIMLPTELGQIAAGVRGLESDFRAQASMPARAGQQRAVQPPASGGGSTSGWRPSDFARQYDLAPLYGSGLNGAGIAIAVAGQAEIDVAAVQAFRSAAGLSTAALSVKRADGGAIQGSSADAAEAELGLEWAGAVAPGAALAYVSAGDALDAASYAIDEDLAPVLLVTHGGCEASFSAADVASLDDAFAQANAEGISVVADAGDAGAAACDAGASVARSGLAARFPASSAHVTAVGASALAGTAASSEAYSPEIGWSSIAELAAGGGGVSAVFAKPVWQQGNGVPADGMRDLPDVSFVGIPPFAESAKDGAPGLAGSSGLVGAPGASTGVEAETTATAAEFAGVVALLAQKMGAAVGNINPRLYALAAQATAGPQVFRDVVAGGNTVPCATGTKDCGPDGLLGFSAGAGYDLATGLGSVDVGALVNAFPEAALATTTTTLSVSSATPAAGATVTLTANIDATGSAVGVGNPTGTMQFLDNGTALSSTAVSGGQAILSATLAAGKTHTLTAVYSGDTNWGGSTSPAVTTNVGTAPTTTVLTVSPNPPVAGSATTLTAGVTAVTPTGLTFPTGTVQFLDNGTALGSSSIVALSSTTTATLTTTLTPGVAHSLTAVYGGDTNWAGSTSAPVLVSTGKAATTTTLAPSSFVVAYGANLTLTATAATTATGITTTPTGTMTFSAATQGVLGTAAVAAGSGTASFSSSKLAAGLYTLTAAYSGDSVFAASTSTTNVQVTVGAATATVTASASPSSGVMYGTTSTITATVQGSGGISPTGTITVTVPGVAGTYTGTLVPNPGAAGSSTVNVTIPAPPPGTYALQVVYGGDTTYPTASTTTTLTTIKGNTVTSITISPNPAVIGVPTTLTATVAPASAVAGTTYVLTGTVQFFDGTTALGAPVGVVNNQAVGSEIFTTLGTHNVTAVYSGDTNWNTSTSGVFTLTVTPIPTTTTLTTNYANNTALAGANIIFTVVVAPKIQSTITGVNSVPTGTVTFYDSFNNSFTTLGSATLVQNGLGSAAATFQTKFFLGGTHVITVVYSGDTNYLTSTGGTIQLTIQDFTLTAVPSSESLNQGNSAQVPIVVTPVAGFTGSVAFGCQPPPNTETTCSVLPVEVTGGGGTVSLLIGTTVAHAQPTQQARGGGGPGRGMRGFGLPVAGMVLAGLGLLAWPRSSGGRRMPRLFVLLMGAALACIVAGCGNGPTTTAAGTGGGTKPSNPGTPQGTITFVVTAVGTDGITSVTHQLTYQVTVQ